MRPVPQAVVDALVEDWAGQGREAVAQLRRWAPRHYAQLVASLTPLAQSTDEKLAALSDEELMKQLHEELIWQEKAGILPPFVRLVPVDDA